MDGKIWKHNEFDQIRRPPLHVGCRCCVIPYIDLGPELEGERPAANADFDRLAEEDYNRQAREKGWKRRYSDLSPSTRMKYYYKAQKDFTARTGKPAYSQVRGDMTFREYFEKQPEEFKRSWLGNVRYDAYQAGKLKFGNLVHPDTGYYVSLKELGLSVHAKKINVKHPTIEQIHENMDREWENVKHELKKTGRKFGDGLKREEHRDYNGHNLPSEGPPNSSADLFDEKTKKHKQRRFYDENGIRDYDIDYNHPGEETHEFPHRHYHMEGGERSEPVWDRSKEKKDDV